MKSQKPRGIPHRQRQNFYFLLLLLIESERVFSSHWTPTSYRSFDDLRSTDSTTTTWEKQQSSNILWVETNSDQFTRDDYNETISLRLADISTFLPFTEGGTKLRTGIHNDAAVALMAMHDFNERSARVVRSSSNTNMKDTPIASWEDCDLYMTLNIFDTQFSPIESTIVLTRDILSSPHTLDAPLPAAVVGAYRSATTSPMAILTGVQEIPQVSYTSTSTDFDDKEQFPLFGRTISSSQQEANAALALFQSWGAGHVAILFVTDSYGSALQKAFQGSATNANVSTISIAFSDSDGSENIAKAIQNIKETQYRMIYAICFESHYPKIMTAAYENGMVGEDFVWIFPGFDTTSFQTQLQYPRESPLALATPGIGILQFAGGVTPDPWIPGVKRNPTLSEKGSDDEDGYERFRIAWRETLQDENWKEYVRSKLPDLSSVYETTQPNPNLEFATEPSIQSHFIYDALIALGMAMCSIQSTLGGEAKADGFLTGPQIYDQFRTLSFEGATGKVSFDPNTGTRQSHPYVLNNVRPYVHTDDKGSEKTSLFGVYPSQFLIDGVWSTLDSFQFANGSNEPPLPLPLVKEQQNLIGTTARGIGYTLMGLLAVSSVASWMWLFFHRKERVVRSSQPIFLFMISLGSLVMALSIVPMGLEETLLDSDILSDTRDSLDRACQTVPWLFLTGTTISFSALFAKTRAVHEAYSNPAMEFIVVTAKDIWIMLALLLAVNWAILVAWTISSPLMWERRFKESTDTFGRPIDSYGICVIDNGLAFVVVVVVLNVGMLTLANYWTYKTRNIETEYHESRYIAIAMASVLQAWSMGIPIFIMVSENPQAKFFVSTGIVLVTSGAILGSIFVPKVLAIYQDRRMKAAENRKKAFQKFSKNKEDRHRWFDQVGGVEQSSKHIQELQNTTAAVPSPAPDSSDGSNSDVGISDPNSESRPTPASAFPHTFTADRNAREATNGSSYMSGIKVLHNPRSSRSLQLAHGQELSREQLELFDSFRQSSGKDDGNLDSHISEAAENRFMAEEAIVEEDSSSTIGDKESAETS